MIFAKVVNKDVGEAFGVGVCVMVEGHYYLRSKIEEIIDDNS